MSDWGPSHQQSTRIGEHKKLIAGVVVIAALASPLVFHLLTWSAVLYGGVRVNRRHRVVDRVRALLAGRTWQAAAPPAIPVTRAGVRLGVERCGRTRLAKEGRAVLVIGPSQSGKTTGVIIPTLRGYAGPVVSTSTKPDVLRATMPMRFEQGRVWQFDPTGHAPAVQGVGELRWSPLSCSRDWDGALLMARAMVDGAAVGAGSTDSTHWARRAQALLAAILHAAAVTGAPMSAVVGWVTSHDIDGPLDRLRQAAEVPLAVDVLTGVANTEERERSSIFSATADALDAYTSQAALAAATGENFEAREFVRSHDTIYIHAPAESQRMAAPLVCGLLAEIRRATYQAHAGGELDGRRVLFALDEVANVAPIAELPQIASEGGGQGLLLLAVLQDLSQARARWGTLADGFLTLFGTKLILPGVADQRTLKTISTALGEYDRKVVTETKAQIPDRWCGSQRSSSHSTQRTRVLSPGDVANIPAGHGLHLDGVQWELLTLTPSHTCGRPECIGHGGAGMLSVAKVTGNLAAGYADYLEGKTTQAELGDYYLRGGERVEAPGRWVSGARRVGCDPDRPVGGQALRELMAVRHPATGEQLRRTGASGEAVAAIDVTFSAPKSVSAIWAMADTELRVRIEAAHEQAIDRALRYATSQVPMVRYRADGGAVVHARAAELIATSWRHTTARAVGERVPDPQLHSHVLLHAAARDDQRVVAIDSRSWFVHRRELGAAYRTELARELTALGFEITRGTGRGGRYFEIAGVPQELIDTWSSRHKQVQQAIRQTLALTGKERLGPAAESRAALVTRRAKQPATVTQLDDAWQRAARDAGFARDELQQLRDPARRTHLEPSHVRELLRGLTEFDATFSDRQARAVALERAAGAPIEQALGALAQARDERAVVRLADGSSTTGWHRHLERDTVTTFESLTRERLQAIPGRHIEQAVAAVNRRLGREGGGLSPEQRQALELACGDRQVVMIEGQAGTGKSTLLQAVALAHQADGRLVIVTSTAAVAAERLATDLAAVGVEAPAYSTVALQHAIATGRLDIDSRTTVIHDEAALASTREQHHLLDTVQENWAQLIIVGDPLQSQPVGAAGLWPKLERQADRQGSRAQLTTNLRALDPDDSRDQARFRDGQHQESLRGYAERGRLHGANDTDAAERAALEAAHRDRSAGKRTLVITQTSNEHLDELNARAQALRACDRQLGYNTLRLPGRPYSLRAGDEIQIRRTITLPDGPVRNGTTATVTGIDPRAGELSVRLPDDRAIVMDREQVRQADLRLAYVQHPVPAQGLTTDTTHLIVADHATAEGTYVALSRAREQTHIYASEEQSADGEHWPIERLAERVGRCEPEIPSIALPLASEPWLRAPRQIDDSLVPEPADTERPDPERGMGWEM